ncbi:MAG TPA: IclR family transcriptional regulator [Candidatus Avamphibacillus sp.]|nr:IclR family transcriptional regulator [Candidatus Avamphibacillus sp.]
MDKKYWVPAIERADKVITIIANESGKLKLMEIAKKSDMNKSSLFSLLNTLEELRWVYKEVDQSYSLGSKLGFLSAQFIQQYDLTTYFDREAAKSVEKVQEAIQLSILEGSDIIYIAKKEGHQRVRINTSPGMRAPAHATAMGKVMLSSLTGDDLIEGYKDKEFEKVTDMTVDNLDHLLEQINSLKENGYIIESQEAVKGFTCIAAPILNERQEIIAAVSYTMTIDNWRRKSEVCKEEIISLAKRISINSIDN